ncbi:PREDICTED: uncharacterized protein K02A2.6-like, partial [Paramuricea clavata]
KRSLQLKFNIDNRQRRCGQGYFYVNHAMGKENCIFCTKRDQMGILGNEIKQCAHIALRTPIFSIISKMSFVTVGRMRSIRKTHIQFILRRHLGCLLSYTTHALLRQSIFGVRDELTINEQLGIILRGTRIIMPCSLRERAIRLAHEGHQGLAKTKQLIRKKIWFPRIDKDVETLIRGCIPCQANGTANHPAPLKMTELPPKPWHTVHVDFCGPFPTGEYTLVVIDAYSRFPEVEIVKSTSATSTISKLERIFATHGLPNILKSDNGPPFQSNEFKQFMTENGIKHQRITPLWPKANSEAENFMKPMEKAIRAAHIEKKNWRKELYHFLLNYRATPHTTTKFAPAELLFNREINTKLPSKIINQNTKIDQQVRANDEKGKRNMKRNADKSANAKEVDIKVGDTVLVRQTKKNKWSTRFDPKPYCVTRVKGTMITATRPGHYITRNISFFKKVLQQEIQHNSEDDFSDNS